jgi:hypothetical protein
MLLSIPSPSFQFHSATSSSNGVPPRTCRYTTRRSVQVHSIAVQLKPYPGRRAHDPRVFHAVFGLRSTYTPKSRWRVRLRMYLFFIPPLHRERASLRDHPPTQETYCPLRISFPLPFPFPSPCLSPRIVRTHFSPSI